LTNAGAETNTVSSNITTTGERTIFADVSGGALTITLASADVYEGKAISIKDSTGNAGTNAITVATEGTETIDGNASITLDANNESVNLRSDGTNWFIESRYDGTAL